MLSSIFHQTSSNYATWRFDIIAGGASTEGESGSCDAAKSSLTGSNMVPAGMFYISIQQSWKAGNPWCFRSLDWSTGLVVTRLNWGLGYQLAT